MSPYAQNAMAILIVSPWRMTGIYLDANCFVVPMGFRCGFLRWRVRHAQVPAVPYALAFPISSCFLPSAESADGCVGSDG